MKQNVKIFLQEIASILVIFGICIAISIPIQNHYIKNKCREMIEHYEAMKYEEILKQQREDEAVRTYIIKMQHKFLVEQQNNLDENNYDK